MATTHNTRHRTSDRSLSRMNHWSESSPAFLPRLLAGSVELPNMLAQMYRDSGQDGMEGDLFLRDLCVCVHVYGYTYVYGWLHMCAQVHMCVWVHMHVRCAHVYGHTCVWVYTCVWLHMCVRVHMCVWVHMHACTHIHEGQRSSSSVILRSCPPCLLRQDLSQALGIVDHARMARQ